MLAIALSVFLGELWIASSVFIFICANVLLNYFFNTRSVIIINSKYEPIVLLGNQPSKKEAKAFADEILFRSKNYLKWKFGKIDKEYPKEIQVKNFRWLRDNEIISDEEYQALKDELLKKD